MSFRLKIILSIALIEGLLLATLVIMSMGIFSETLDEELSKRGRTTAKVFAATTLDHVISSDLGGLESFGDAVMETPGMVYIRVIDDQGIVMVAKGDADILKRAFHEDMSLEAAEDDGVYDTFSNVSQDGMIFGRIEIGLEIKALHDILTKSRNRATGIALIEIFLVALFSFALGTYLTRQIKVLTDGVHRLEDGELGHEIEVSSDDELGQLAHSFNKLSLNLRSSEKEHERQSHYLKEIIHNIYDGVMIISSAGIIEKINPAVSRIFGFDEATLVGNNVSFMLPEGKHKTNHDQYLKEAMKESFDLKSIIERKDDFTVLKEDGTKITVSISVNRMHGSNDEVHFVAIISDVTKRKQIEAALASALEMEQEVNRSKTEFFAKISHELRTPMNGVLGMLHLLKNTSLKSTQQHYVESAKSSGELMVSIVNDILDFSKLDAEKLELEEVAFDPVALSEEIVTLLAKDTYAKGLALYCTPSFSLPGKVIGDPMRIRQILMNLMGNAIKFTQAGNIHLKMNWDEGHLIFSVKDTGVGMTEEQQEKIFEPFQQADNTTTRKFGGTGLGLTITTELIARMDGTIKIISEVGTGTEFVCRLPLEIPLDDVGRFDVVEDWSEQQIMVVSNDESFMGHITDILPQAVTGAMTHVATLGKAIAIADTWKARTSPPYNILIIDLDRRQIDDVPLMEGLEIFHKECNLPILTYSKNNRPDIKKFTTVSLRKPVCSSLLFDMLHCLRNGENTDSILPSGKSEENPNRWFGERKILLVDDNLVNQEIGYELLKSVGFDVDICNNGKEAVAAVQDKQYEAVLMDVQMPIMDGLEASRTIRALGGKYLSLPIIAITANASNSDRESTKNAGMDEHIEKPFDPELLYKTLAPLVPHDHLSPGEGPPAYTNEENPIPDIEGIDIAAGLERLRGNEKVYRKILCSFRQDQANISHVISEHLQQGRSEKAASLAHSLKGSSGNIGAQEIYKVAASLEQSCLAGDIDIATEKLEALRGPLDKVIAGLAIMEDEQKDVIIAQQKLSEANYQEILFEIEHMIECFDTDLGEARSLWEKIQPYLNGRDYREDATKLDTSINTFEISGAKLIALKICQHLSENYEKEVT